MKLLLFFLLSILLVNKSFGQQDLPCGTEPTAQEIAFMQAAKPQYEAAERNFLQHNGRNSSIHYMPISIHIVRETNGSGGILLADLQEALDTMNSFYSNANIQFTICDTIAYIDNSTHYDFSYSNDASFTAQYNRPSLINIYFFNTITSSGGGLCGYASFPGGNDRIMMQNACALNGSTLAHEMGHFLGLYHTHGKTNTGTTAELVNGSNCSFEGDDICDTDADPNLSGNVDINCNYTGTGQDANGDSYTPDPYNVMSYSRKFCRERFSPMQYARVYAVATTVRNYFTCPNFSANFNADVTHTCQDSLTVQFTDNSIGANSWAWDIDADGVVDYTTANVTHRYTTPGIYTVHLEVTDTGSSVISRIKTDYISVGQAYPMPYVEDFETFTESTNGTGLENGWANNPTGVTSQYRWTPNAGATPSSSTGPTVDNTLGTTAGLFMYTEATNGSAGDTTILLSPCISISGTMPMLEFYSHLYGTHIGELHVDIFDGSTWTNDVMPAITAATQTTAQAAFSLNSIDISAFTNKGIRIRFRAIRGNGFRGDIALDDINIYDAMPSTVNTVSDKKQSIKIYPNPSRDEFTISLKSERNEVAMVSIYNQLGALILQQKENLEGGLNAWQLNLSAFPAGAYILNVQTAKEHFTERLMLLD